MATPQALFVSEGDNVDYTAGSALEAGDVLEASGQAGVLVTDLASGALGALRIKGIVNVQKDNSAITDGLQVGWDIDGTTVNGATGGALTATVASMDFVVGRAIEAAGTAVADCQVALNEVGAQAITNSTGGTAATTLAALEATYTQTTVANAFASIYAILEKAGIVAT